MGIEKIRERQKLSVTETPFGVLNHPSDNMDKIMHNSFMKVYVKEKKAHDEEIKQRLLADARKVISFGDTNSNKLKQQIGIERANKLREEDLTMYKEAFAEKRSKSTQRNSVLQNLKQMHSQTIDPSNQSSEEQMGIKEHGLLPPLTHRRGSINANQKIRQVAKSRYLKE